jgi:glutamyl-tRNA synthetase
MVIGRSAAQTQRAGDQGLRPSDATLQWVTTRVRFAPSPTGSLHLGSARTALFNWLFARSAGGEFLVRIEDTDAERSRPELIQQVFDTLDWLGLDWDNRGDEPRQSERADQYREAVDRMLAEGRAYACNCERAAVDARNSAAGRPPGYDGFCRDRALTVGPDTVARFATPSAGTVEFDDVIRGHVSFECANLEDFVIARSDGSVTFLLANAIDDDAMGITHVMRGEDLLNTTPKSLLLRQAIGGGEPPVYAHLPLIVGEGRKKLSKRRDDVAVENYRDAGYLPEAMVNYLALLGWGPSDGIEVRPLNEIVEMFSLEAINPSPAAFDAKKLAHVNAEKLRALDADEFLRASEPFLAGAPWEPAGFDRDVFVAIAPEVQSRVKTLGEVPAMVDFFFLDAPLMDEASVAKAITNNPDAPELLAGAIRRFESETWSAEALHAATLELGEAHGLKLGKAQAPIRVAVTGRTVGPPLFEALVLLGRTTTLDRLKRASRSIPDEATTIT